MEAIVDAKRVSGAHPPDTRHGALDNLTIPHDGGSQPGQVMLRPDLLEYLLETTWRI